MLEALRKGTGTWIAKIFIGLLVLSFAVWGIADIFGGYGTRSLATVGDAEISPEEYRLAYQIETRLISRQIGRNLTLEEARALGLDNRVLSRLVSEAAVAAHGNKLGLGLTDRAIAEGIMREPAFQDASGAFNRRQFEQILIANGLSEQSYVARQREVGVRRQLTETVGEASPVPATLLAAVHRYQNEERVLRHFVLPVDRLEPIPEPDEAALRAYYEANPQTFTAPEYRKLTLLIVTPDTVSGSIEVREEEIAAYYEQNRERFVTPERRRIHQMVFTDQAEAEAAHERIRGGADFMEVARQRGLAEGDVDLGLLTRQDIADPAVAEAAFALEAGTVSTPVQGRFGWVLVRVTEVQPEVAKSLEEAKDEIRRSLRAERARFEIHDLHDRIEDQRAGGARLGEIAQALDLRYVEIAAMDRSGRTPSGLPVEGVPVLDRVAATAFDSEVGLENDPVETEDQGVVWVDVLGVTPSRLRPFEEVRAEVEEAWRADQQRSRLAEKAQALVEGVRKGGQTLDQVAQELGLEVRQSPPVKRNAEPQDLSRAAVAQAFALPEGGIASSPTGDGTGRVVFQVMRVETPPPPEGEEAEAIRQALREQLADDLVTQYVTGLRDVLGVTINTSLFNQVAGRG